MSGATQLATDRLTRQRPLLIASGLLDASAVLIVVQKRGFLDALAGQLAGWIGLVLAVCGLLDLVYIDRFRTTIGRLMTVVAIFAVTLQGSIVYWNWLERRLAALTGLEWERR